jgi:hypothetical protein
LEELGQNWEVTVVLLGKIEWVLRGIDGERSLLLRI